MLATFVAGMTFLGQDFGPPTNVLLGVLAVAAAATVGIHGRQRRKVRPSFSRRGGLFVIGMVVVAWVVIGLWGTAVSSIGYGELLWGWAIVGWLVTSAFFLLVRSGLQAMRQRRGTVL